MQRQYDLQGWQTGSEKQHHVSGLWTVLQESVKLSCYGNDGACISWNVKCLQNEERGLTWGTQISERDPRVYNSRQCVLCILLPMKRKWIFLVLVFNTSLAYACLVPEKVRNLVSYNEIWMKSFAVNWTPPAGDWEHYRILLFNDSLALLNATVGKEEAHYVMDGVELIPGRQYEVEVMVESGNLRNSERCRGRTGKQTWLGLWLTEINSFPCIT